MGDPKRKGGAAIPSELRKNESEADSNAVRSTRPKRAAGRLTFQALETSSSAEESDDGNYEPSGDERSDDSSNGECPSDDKEIQEESANRSDGLGDRLAKYQEAFKLAVLGVPPCTAALLPERIKSAPKMAPAPTPDYFHHFTDRVQRVNELKRSIASGEKLLEECKLAAVLLEHRANSCQSGTALREIQEIGSLLKSFGVTNVHTSHEYLKEMQVRMNKMRKLDSPGRSEGVDDDSKEAESS